MISIGRTRPLTNRQRARRRLDHRRMTSRRLRGLGASGAVQIFAEIVAEEEKKLRELFSRPWDVADDAARRAAIDAANTRVDTAYRAAIAREDLSEWDRAELSVIKNAWDRFAIGWGISKNR